MKIRKGDYMKDLKIILLLGLTLLVSGCADKVEEKVMIEQWAINNIPAEARVIEHVLVVGPSTANYPRSYVIFEFRQQCFLFFNGYNRSNLTTINCPGDNK